MFSKIKNIFHTIRANYVIVANYVETKPGQTVPELVEKLYIVFDEETNITEFTPNLNEATRFSFLLGSAITKTLRKNQSTYPNLQIEMSPVSDIMFVDEVVNGPLNNVEGNPADIKKIADELAEKLMQSPDVFGVNVIITGVDGKGPVKEHIEITVKNPDAQNKVTHYIDAHQKYKTVPTVVTISKQHHAL